MSKGLPVRLQIPANAWHPTETVDRALPPRPRALAWKHTLVLADALERIAHARAAAKLANTGAAGPAMVLPVWQWTRPNKPIGRKHYRPQPVRLTWDTPVVVPVTRPLPDTLTWHAVSLGWNATGTEPGPAPHSATIISLPTVDQIAASETDAIWRILTEFEPVTSAAVETAASHNTTSPDRETLHALRDELLYGTSHLNDPHSSTHAPSSKALRLIDKLLDPQWARNVDPLKAATRTLKRDAYDAVAALKDDPRCGSSVRQLAVELDLTPPYTAGDIKWLIAVYRQRHPDRADPLGYNRAWRALHTTNPVNSPIPFSALTPVGSMSADDSVNQPFEPADPDTLTDSETHRRLTRIA